MVVGEISPDGIMQTLGVVGDEHCLLSELCSSETGPEQTPRQGVIQCQTYHSVA